MPSEHGAGATLLLCPRSGQVFSGVLLLIMIISQVSGVLIDDLALMEAVSARPPDRETHTQS